MKRFASAILKYRVHIIAIFTFLFLVSAFFAAQVRINYDLSAYLPEHAASTQALRAVKEEFSHTLPNLQLVAEDIEIADALLLKERLLSVPEVTEVNWLDDLADPLQPEEVFDKAITDVFYKEKTAQFIVAVETSDYAGSLAKIREAAGIPVAMAGSAVDMARAANSVTEEMGRILLFAAPITLLILILSTTSYFEPVLFMIAIGVGVILNMGSNYLLGEISYITQSVGAVLQLAVSMDYGIFVLHRFGLCRKQGDDVETAMKKAIVSAFSSVTSSALTTVFGFLALVFMQFRIGPDMGIVLAKGIFFSLVSVLLLLPALTLVTVRAVDRTTHRSFLPSAETMRKAGRGILRISPVILLVMLLSVYPVFRAQRSNHFLYGMGNYPEDSVEEKERSRILERFGENRQVVLLLPKGDSAKEELLSSRIEQLPHVSSVISYSGMVGNQIPREFLDPAQAQTFESENYSRIIVSTDLPEESADTFATGQKLRALSEEYYGKEALWAGSPFSLLDMRETVNQDNRIVNGLAILSIGIVLLLTFRSFSLPVILVFSIEFAIWCNLSIPFFSGTPLNYIGYLVISTIQLGATVDYAILSTQHYLEFRREKNAREAAEYAVATAMPAIIPPALVLAAVGYILSLVSTISIVSEIGLVLGRGALLSLLTVILILPAFLRFLDPIIGKTGFGHRWSAYHIKEK